jgi:RNA polymerase sigma-B factor
MPRRPADISSVTTLSSHHSQHRQDAHERELRTQQLLEEAVHAEPAERQRLWDEVVLLNRGAALSIANRYRGRGVDADDLEQVALLGLVKAVHGFKVGEGPGFLAYAVPTISGEVKRHFRDYGWSVRPPRRVQELRGAMAAAEAELTQNLGRTPTRAEAASALGVEPEDISTALAADGCFSAMSLDAPSRFDTRVTLGDLIVDDSDDFSDVERHELLRPVLEGLKERDRLILRLRFVGGCTQEEIGRELGVSQMQVSRLLSSIMARLRAGLVGTQAS